MRFLLMAKRLLAASLRLPVHIYLISIHLASKSTFLLAYSRFPARGSLRVVEIPDSMRGACEPWLSFAVTLRAVALFYRYAT